MTDTTVEEVRRRFDELLRATDLHYHDTLARLEERRSARDAAGVAAHQEALARATELIEILESVTHSRVRRLVR